MDCPLEGIVAHHQRPEDLQTAVLLQRRIVDDIVMATNT